MINKKQRLDFKSNLFLQKNMTFNILNRIINEKPNLGEKNGKSRSGIV